MAFAGDTRDNRSQQEQTEQQTGYTDASSYDYAFLTPDRLAIFNVNK